VKKPNGVTNSRSNNVLHDQKQTGARPSVQEVSQMRHSPTIPECQRLPNRRVAEHIEDLNEAVPAAFAQGWLNYVHDHAHQQCKMNSPRVRDVAASPLGVPLDLLTEQGTGSAP
jgi:hypothetical protein